MNCKDILNKDEITPDEVQDLLKARDDNQCNFILMDIREQYEYDNAHIDGCDVLFPTSTFMQQIDNLSKYSNTRVVMYCRSANRTAQVLGYLTSKGYSNFSHMIYGINYYKGNIIRG